MVFGKISNIDSPFPTYSKYDSISTISSVFNLLFQYCLCNSVYEDGLT